MVRTANPFMVKIFMFQNTFGPFVQPRAVPNHSLTSLGFI